MRTVSWLTFGIGFIAAVAGVVVSEQLHTMALELWEAHHGAVFFIGVGLSGFLLWPIAGAALVWSHRTAGRATFLVAMCIQYVIALQSVAESGEGDRLAHLWESEARQILSFLGVYLAAQAVLWGAFFARVRRTNGQTSKRHFTLTKAMLTIAILALFAAPILIAARWILSRGGAP
jgi:uncharacterized membrane protein